MIETEKRTGKSTVSATDQDCRPLSNGSLVETVRGPLWDGSDDGTDIEIMRRRTFKRRRDWRGDRLFERATLGGTKNGEVPILIKYAARTRETNHSVEALAREARVYRDYLAGAGLGTPEFVASVASPEGSQRALITEFVRGRRLKRIEEKRVWAEVAAWLAGMHERFLGETTGRGNGDGPAALVLHDADFFWCIAERLVRALPDTDGIVDLGRSLLSRYERVAEVLSSGVSTLVHGEFYCTNILVVRDESERRGLRVCPFDWETAAFGCGALDLVHLLRHELPIDRQFLIDAYLDGWQPEARPGRDELEVQLGCARIHELAYLTWQGVRCESIGQRTLRRRLNRMGEWLSRL